jgi:hypothetical protein
MRMGVTKQEPAARKDFFLLSSTVLRFEYVDFHSRNALLILHRATEAESLGGHLIGSK